MKPAEDVDGDGLADYLFASLAQVEIVSRASSSIVRTFVPPTPGGNAYSVVDADARGDFDGDGYADVMIGLPYDPFLGLESGSVWIYSGRTSQLLTLLRGTAPFQRFGSSVAFLGDVDGDGRDDFAIGAPGADGGRGRVRIYSGASGAVLSQSVGINTTSGYGAGLSRVADLDGDGILELAVRAFPQSCCSSTAIVHVLTPPSGMQLLQFTAVGGNSVENASDVNGDGIGDLVVGFNGFGQSAKPFRIYSGSNGALIGEAPVSFAQCCSSAARISAVADLDGDGLAQEFLLGWFGDSSIGAGSIQVYRGLQRLATIYSIGYSGGTSFGGAPATIPDTNGDGADDFLTYRYLEGSAENVLVMTAINPPPEIYCTAKVNSQGCTPSVYAVGVASLTATQTLSVMASNIVNQKLGLFLWSSAAAATPFQGGVLCVASPVRRTAPQSSGGSAVGADCSGTLSFTAQPSFLWIEGFELGDEVFGQFWYRDPAHPDGTAAGLSNAVGFLMCF